MLSELVWFVFLIGDFKLLESNFFLLSALKSLAGGMAAWPVSEFFRSRNTLVRLVAGFFHLNQPGTKL